MSIEAKEEVVAADTCWCCASCGLAAVDDVKLKDCDGGCDIVKYCNDDCQENHIHTAQNRLASYDSVMS